MSRQADGVGNEIVEWTYRQLIILVAWLTEWLGKPTFNRILLLTNRRQDSDQMTGKRGFTSHQRYIQNFSPKKVLMTLLLGRSNAGE